MVSPLGTDDYHEGALIRLGDARRLSDQERWVGAIYLAGRAVECILRSLWWLKTGQPKIGHDLRDLLRRARSLGMLGADDAKLHDYINEVAVVWYNNLRFVGDSRFLRDLKAVGRDKRAGGQKVKGDALKANARWMVGVCEAIVSRGDLVWKHCRTE